MATLVVWLLAFCAPAFAVTNQIASVSPSSAPQGTNGLLVTFTLSASPPPPGTGVPINSVMIGTNVGSAAQHTNQYTIVAQFNIPNNESVGAKDATIVFPPSVYFVKASGFTVTQATTLTASFTATPTSGTVPLTVNFSDTSTGAITNRLWNFGDSSSSTETNPVHTYNAVGNYTVSLTVADALGSNTLTRAGYITVTPPPTNGAYVVADTGQTLCWNNSNIITCAAAGQPFYGQDSQHTGRQPAYQNNGDGTITDLTTGLMWVQARGTKITWEAARTNAAACTVGGHTDWRFPTIKELYSLIQFTGANGQSFTNTVGYIPFIDTNYFGFAYGSGIGDERVIDCQDWSATAYVSTTMNGDATIFGVNFADGRIKGYPKYVPGSGGTTGQVMYARYVRGNTGYAINKFVNNGDGTITDQATGLMWSRNDSGTGLNWLNALAYAQAQNAANYLGHNDWRLPNAKELQSIVDYTRSPATTASPALHAMFNCTGITNEGGQADYPFFYASTTLLDGTPAASGVYVCFGRALGYMNGSWLDVHGAGAQRSDFKAGNPADYPTGRGPQGDVVRIYNFVRLVRDVPVTTAWRFAFVGDMHETLTTIPAEIASAVVADGVKLFIVAGDLTESGAAASTNTLGNQLTAWRDALAPVYANGIPVYVIRGNHEDDVPNGLIAWNNFFSGANAMPGNGPTGESNLTYSLAYSNALFVGLDDYVNIHRVNQSWLNQQLSANTRPHLFVFGHEAAFKAFHTDCLDDYPDERNTFWSSLVTAGARVYLCGHDHLFNVARIDDGDGNTGNDLYQFIVGTGGSTNWPVQRYSYNGTNSPYTPVNMASVTNTYGYLLVEVSGPGTNDLGVTLTWKQRTYDSNTASHIYVATSNILAYTAVNRLLDSVGDGITDWWRQQYFGGSGTTTNASSCAACDPDRDGLVNWQEYIAGTNPTNASSCLKLQSLSNCGSAAIILDAVASRTYSLFCTDGLTPSAWVKLADVPSRPTNWTAFFPDPAATTNRFYRAVTPQQP